MTPLSNLLSELKRLDVEATKAPWGCDGPYPEDSSADLLEMTSACRMLIGETWGNFGAGDKRDGGCAALADAALIVAMRNGLGALIERIEKLERVAELARKLVAEAPYESGHSGRCDRNTDRRVSTACECGTDDWTSADAALCDALEELGQ